MNYNKTSLPELVSVKTVISIFRRVIDHTVPPDVHDFLEICYVERGTSAVLIDGVRTDVREGELIIFAPNSVHAGIDDRAREAVTLNNVCFEGDIGLLADYMNRPLTLSVPQREHILEIVGRGSPHFERVYGLGGMAKKAGTSEYELKRLKNELELFLTGVLESLESELSNTASNTKKHVSESFRLLDEYLSVRVGENLSIDDMANALSVSTSTLKGICRSGCGMSPAAYFIHIKTERAKMLIAKSGMNFTQIAEALGYSSVHYFSKQFKDKVGVTPSEYAKTYNM